MLSNVNAPDLIELVGINWSRRWTRIRTVVLIALTIAMLAAPGTALKAVESYAHHRAAELTKLMHRTPLLSPPTPSTSQQ